MVLHEPFSSVASSRCDVPSLRSAALTAAHRAAGRAIHLAKLFADIGALDDVRIPDLSALLSNGPSPPAQVTAQHIQALRKDLRAEALSHAAGLTAHTCIVLYGLQVLGA